ncbi:electron transfer flavoprotein subunit beta/FixA family protein [Candidatus Acetothermia bacterium]|nr:electron transfer flavoprotein subunit beta/FixA family protein [Candidatus Acetothermia bacterium]MBI3643186.1 electron transfer flavoprotein subunit beta/FixA family protein [Candidatus Acetothermia bacterium]
MNTLVCIKRVPDTGARFALTSDGQDIDSRNLEFTISPHEECAVEEAIRIQEKQGGSTAVLTLGPEVASEQIRESLAKGIDRGVLLETDGSEWDPQATSQAIVNAVQSIQKTGTKYDLVLFGNESADSGDYQVGVRVAAALDWPCITGIKSIEFQNNQVVAKREAPGGWELFRLTLPAVVTVKEGINVPRHPSLRGIMTAKKKEIERIKPAKPELKLLKQNLRKPQEKSGEIQILGHGIEAVPAIVAKLKELGVI